MKVTTQKAKNAIIKIPKIGGTNRVNGVSMINSEAL
jgi:hypothetical protein